MMTEQSSLRLHAILSCSDVGAERPVNTIRPLFHYPKLLVSPDEKRKWQLCSLPSFYCTLISQLKHTPLSHSCSCRFSLFRRTWKPSIGCCSLMPNLMNSTSFKSTPPQPLAGGLPRYHLHSDNPYASSNMVFFSLQSRLSLSSRLIGSIRCSLVHELPLSLLLLYHLFFSECKRIWQTKQ